MKSELREIASKLSSYGSGKSKSSQHKHNSVKPISAHDQHTLDSAISLARELASRSMLELGSGSFDHHHHNNSHNNYHNHLYNDHHNDSPRTPNSPDKKKSFHFKFKSFCRSYSEASANIPDVQSSFSQEAKLVYDTLVDKGFCTTSKSSLRPGDY